MDAGRRQGILAPQKKDYVTPYIPNSINTDMLILVCPCPKSHRGDVDGASRWSCTHSGFVLLLKNTKLGEYTAFIACCK